MRARVLVVAAALATVALCSCAGTVDGRGSHRASALDALPSVGSTSPAVSTTASASPTVSPTPSVTPARRLNCPAGAITVTGAPFCYPLPPGFTDFSTLSNYGTGWTYKTLVSVDQHDLVEVFASRYADTSALSDAELLRKFNSFGRLQVGKYDIVRAGGVTPIRVAGARAFRQIGRYGNGVATDYTTIFVGSTIASIQCQSQDHPAEVGIACATVRSTLQLASL